MDKHFTIAGAALSSAAKAIETSYPECVKDVSVDGDNDSAEIIFSVVVDGEKKIYLLKLEEMAEDDCTCKKCGSYLDDDSFCKDVTCPFSDHLQTEDITRLM